MSAIERQNRLLVADDWKKIYYSFQKADFQSYDFENLRRVMVDYIRLNYPEDFNDYIENSEFVALIDVIAYLGQSISFRIDLNSRENFLDTASRRDSILRLARLVGYNAKRNLPARGLLKFVGVTTTERVIDSNGRNLADQYIGWDETANANWYDQFVRILNAAMPVHNGFGSPIDSGEVAGIHVEQYRLNGANTDLPIYPFTKTVAGRNINFEITSTTFKYQNYIYEEPPKAGNSLAFVYRNDGHGNSSPNTGFFLNFTQGHLNTGTFDITTPRTNEVVPVNSSGINNYDVWLYKLGTNGLVSELWEQVSSTNGNTISYNNTTNKAKNIYSVITRANDMISIGFGDGTFGKLPNGSFRIYHRQSNGLTYSISPIDMRNITISIPYFAKNGNVETLKIVLALTNSVSNSSPSETDGSIKANAPATYYTQNRMITGEDYNISPLGVSQQILKVKSVNRSSSGISRYFDLSDPTGKYSSTNLYANDGILYREDSVQSTQFSYANKTDIAGLINNDIIPIIRQVSLRNFYYTKYIVAVPSTAYAIWKIVSTDINSSTGNIYNSSVNQPYRVGTEYTSDTFKYISIGSLIRFNAPTDQQFDTNNQNKLVAKCDAAGCVDYIWAEVVKVVGNGTTQITDPYGTTGAIRLNIIVPDTAIVAKLIPKYRTDLHQDTIRKMIDLITGYKRFGLRYDGTKQQWVLLSGDDITTTSDFSIATGWMLLFDAVDDLYTVRSRGIRYVFESDKQLRFFYDNKSKIYDSRTNRTIRDTISILNINTQPAINPPKSYTTDLIWHVVSDYIGLDGFVDSRKIVVSFADMDTNGVVDNPELFVDIIEPDSTINYNQKYIIQKKYIDVGGHEEYRYVNNDDNQLIIIDGDDDSVDKSTSSDGQYFYFLWTNVVKRFDKSSYKFTASLDYRVHRGRADLKFQYIHNTSGDSRIDPGTSNIMDVYVLTQAYDTEYRLWANGVTTTKPIPPNSAELYDMMAPSLNQIKSVSDEVVYHPVTYQLLFGNNALPELQATFKVTKSYVSGVSDNNIKSRVLSAINRYFAIERWNFGDTFYFTEMAAYVIMQLTGDITNFVIVPRQLDMVFGNLFEIPCSSNQIFVSGVSISDIEIISGITPTNIRTGHQQQNQNFIQ